MFRVALVLVFGLVVLAPCFAAEPPDARQLWAYEGGWFAKAKDGSWYEMNEFTFRKLGKPSAFREAKRTPEYVELFDEGRKVGVRLYKGRSDVRHPGDSWRELYKGRWKAPFVE